MLNNKLREISLINEYIRKIKENSEKKIRVMEICGGHTIALHKSGFCEALKNEIEFLSGPGCPVCVTAMADIDKILYLAQQPMSILCIYGDLFRVPGTDTSLMYEKAKGCDIRIVYSVHDALELALREPNKIVYFAGIGFETTAPLTAAAIMEAFEKKVENFRVLSFHKTVPEAVRALLIDSENRIDAFVLPGNVSSITGVIPYEFITKEFYKPCVVSGFEPLDLISSIYELIMMTKTRKNEITNNYKRAVKYIGNVKAQEILNNVFEKCSADWRGIGQITGSGLRIKNKYELFNAENFVEFPANKKIKNNNCICGEILKGRKKPFECGLFKNMCTPDSPYGACMVSNEGACGAFYKYGQVNDED